MVNKIGHGESFKGFSSNTDLGTYCVISALHELDPIFRKVTLENERLKSLVRDLKFHRNPVGEKGHLPVMVAFPVDFGTFSTSIHGDNQTTSDWRRRYVVSGLSPAPG